MAIKAFVINVIGVGIAFGLQILQARALGAREFGLLMYVLAWVNILTIAGKAGMDTAALRFIPEYIVKNEWRLLRGFIGGSAKYAILISIVLAMALASTIMLMRNSVNYADRLTYLVACVLLPLNVYIILQGSYLQAFKRVIVSQTVQVIVRPTIVAAAFLFGGFILDQKMAAVEGVWIAVGAAIISALIFAVAIQSNLPRHAIYGEREYRAKIWRGAAFSMLLITGFNTLMNQTDILMVGMLLTPKDAGVYSAVSRISMFVPFAIVLVNSITAPLISQLYTEGKRQQLQKMITYVGWGSIAFSVPVCVVIAVSGKYLLSWYGDEFFGALDALLILLVARLIVAITGSAGYLMSMSGNQRKSAYIHGGVAMLDVLLNAALIPIYGIEGAATATAIATAAYGIAMVSAAKRTTGINATIFQVSRWNDRKGNS